MSDDLPLLGFGLPVAGSWATPAGMVRVARRAEELGYAALWTHQRLLRPASVGRSHEDVHDPLLTLAHVASHTERIGLGTATICAPYVAPAVLAGAVTTLDHLCGGRLTVGLGIGWMREEYVAAGVPWERRGARMEEYLRCLDVLLTQDPVEFSGEFYTVPRSHVGPSPVQSPRPPVLVGGSAPPALRRAGRLADGWIVSSRHHVDEVGRGVALVREGAVEAGRDPDAVRVLLRAVVDLRETDPGPGRAPFQGTVEQVRDDLRRLRAVGVTEAFADLNLSPRVGSHDTDAASALDEAERVLVALAPGARDGS